MLSPASPRWVVLGPKDGTRRLISTLNLSITMLSPSQGV